MESHGIHPKIMLETLSSAEARAGYHNKNSNNGGLCGGGESLRGRSLMGYPLSGFLTEFFKRRSRCRRVVGSKNPY